MSTGSRSRSAPRSSPAIGAAMSAATSSTTRLHYLSLLEKKPGALDQAAPLRGWKLDPAFDTLRRLLEARFGPRGKREYIQVLRLHEDFPERQVTAAVRDAVKRRLIGFDAVKHLLLARIERRPVHLDLSRYPHLPQPLVAATRSADYATLLAGGAGHAEAPRILLEHHLKRLKLADLPAGIRETGAPVRGRGPGSCAVPGPAGGAGADRPRAPPRRTAYQAGRVPCRQTARELRLQGDPGAQQDAGAGSRPRRVHRAPRERNPARPERRRKDPCRSRPRPRRLPEGPRRALRHRPPPGPRADRGARREEAAPPPGPARQGQSPDRRRARLRAPVADRKRAAVRRLQPALRRTAPPS